MRRVAQGAGLLAGAVVAALVLGGPRAEGGQAQPTFCATWVEALADGGYNYHCRVDVSRATQQEIALAVQFRLADANRTEVQAKGGRRPLLLFSAAGEQAKLAGA